MNKLLFLAVSLSLLNYDAIPSGNVLRIIPIILLCIVILTNVNILGKIRFFPTFGPLLFLIFLVSIGIVSSDWAEETFLFKIFKVLTINLFSIALLIGFFKSDFSDPFASFVKIVFYPLLVFISVNFILYLIGFQSYIEEESIGKAILLSYVGVDIERVRFPLVSGINAYGAFTGSILLYSLIGWSVIKRFKLLFLVGIIVTLLTLLFTDSRGPMFFAVVIFIIIKYVYSKAKAPKGLYLIPLIGFVGPILLIWILTFLSQTSYGEGLSRTSEDLATGNGRLLIWGLAINEFLDFKISHIWGYGEYGHYTSGLSQQWAFIFGSRETAEYVHPHNTILSILFDYGYIGLMAFITVQISIIKTIRKIWNKHREVAYIILSNLLFFNLVGITETMFGLYYQNILNVFLMINIIAFALLYIESIAYNKRMYHVR